MASTELVANDKNGAWFVKCHDRFYISIIESLFEKEVNFLWLGCSHSPILKQLADRVISRRAHLRAELSGCTITLRRSCDARPSGAPQPVLTPVLTEEEACNSASGEPARS
jgi:glutamate racemase